MRRNYTCCRDDKKRKWNQGEKDKSIIFTMSNFERECASLKVADLKTYNSTADIQDMPRRKWRL